MHSATRFVWAATFSVLLAVSVCAAEYRFVDDEPEVKDRVARISFINGDVQIKRLDTDQWEKAVLNLPIVQGDELTTGPNSRFEIQFGAYSHLRVSESAIVKVTSLSDNLIALGLPEGSASVTLTRFDIANEAFEIDAPRTTLAIQKAGRYRIDSGHINDQSIRISVNQEGESRVYSSNTGFTLREGRSAKIYIDGNLAGEWETGDTTRFIDDFDKWSYDRDATIAKRQGQAYYGKYYDTDIYAADDLNDNGEWINTRDYGYVWRPYQNAVSGYTDWSPYRYGAWRWVPSYGWSWVNDEPWGWATYHHGRWIWYNGGWYWAPYGYYRTSRSWWFPALVVLQQFNRSICWYPLPYNHRFYNYNGRYHRDRNQRNWNNAPGQKDEGPNTLKRGVATTVPNTGVITVPIDDFGKGRVRHSSLPGETARTILAKMPTTQDELPILPSIGDISSKVSDEIRVIKPRGTTPIVATRVGAAKRDQGEPLDKVLYDKILLGNRPPVVTKTDEVSEPPQPPGQRDTPPIGAVRRSAAKAAEPQRTIIPMPSNDSPGQKSEPQNDAPKQDVPIYAPSRRNVRPPQKDEPRAEPTKRDAPVNSSPRRSEPSPQRSEPSNDEPRKSDPPPQKSEQRSEPSKRSDPPPQKSETPRSEPSKQSEAPTKKP
ncbi:MAG: DUF6600 domain-containing protein [Pyrinomonadaceae bacterium]